MAIEDLLIRLTTAVEDLTETMKSDMKLRETAIGIVQNAAETPAAAAKKAAAAAVTSAAAAATSTSTSATSATAAASGEDRVTDEQAATMQAKMAAYIGGADRPNTAWAEAERAARKGKMRNLLQHDQIKVPGTDPNVFDPKNVKASAYDTFIKNVDGLTAKGDITAEPAAAGGGANLDL